MSQYIATDDVDDSIEAQIILQTYFDIADMIYKLYACSA